MDKASQNAIHHSHTVRLGRQLHDALRRDGCLPLSQKMPGRLQPGAVVRSAVFATKVRSHGFSLDALGYVPVQDKFELIGTAGLTWTKAKLTIEILGVGSGSDSDSEIGFRVGGGAHSTSLTTSI